MKKGDGAGVKACAWPNPSISLAQHWPPGHHLVDLWRSLSTSQVALEVPATAGHSSSLVSGPSTQPLALLASISRNDLWAPQSTAQNIYTLALDEQEQ